MVHPPLTQCWLQLDPPQRALSCLTIGSEASHCRAHGKRLCNPEFKEQTAKFPLPTVNLQLTKRRRSICTGPPSEKSCFLNTCWEQRNCYSFFPSIPSILALLPPLFSSNVVSRKQRSLPGRSQKKTKSPKTRHSRRDSVTPTCTCCMDTGFWQLIWRMKPKEQTPLQHKQKIWTVTGNWSRCMTECAEEAWADQSREAESPPPQKPGSQPRCSRYQTPPHWLWFSRPFTHLLISQHQSCISFEPRCGCAHSVLLCATAPGLKQKTTQENQPARRQNRACPVSAKFWVIKFICFAKAILNHLLDGWTEDINLT